MDEQADKVARAAGCLPLPRHLAFDVLLDDPASPLVECWELFSRVWAPPSLLDGEAH